MSNLKAYLLKHPLFSAIALPLIRLVLPLVFAGMVSSVLKFEFGSSTALSIAHLVMILCLLNLLWKFNGLIFRSSPVKSHL